jgi:hypothetical protein
MIKTDFSESELLDEQIDLHETTAVAAAVYLDDYCENRKWTVVVILRFKIYTKKHLLYLFNE